MSYADYEVSKKPLKLIRPNADFLPFEFGDKFFRREAILGWVFQKRAIQPAVERLLGYFFKEKAPTRSKHAADFADRLLPIWYVVDDAKVKDRVI